MRLGVLVAIGQKRTLTDIELFWQNHAENWAHDMLKRPFTKVGPAGAFEQEVTVIFCAIAPLTQSALLTTHIGIG